MARWVGFFGGLVGSEERDERRYAGFGVVLFVYLLDASTAVGCTQQNAKMHNIL